MAHKVTPYQRSLRADSHYCSPEVLDWCRANGLDYLLGVAPSTSLRQHIETPGASAKASFETAHNPLWSRYQTWC